MSAVEKGGFPRRVDQSGPSIPLWEAEGAGCEGVGERAGVGSDGGTGRELDKA